MEDSKGGIWVVTQTGLSLYHGKTDKFELLLPPGTPLRLATEHVVEFSFPKFKTLK